MTQVTLNFNNKTLFLEFGNDELYIKLINADGVIAFIVNNDLPAIADLAKKINASTQTEGKEALLKATELLYSWPNTIPVYQWRDKIEAVSPINDHVFVVKFLSINLLTAKSIIKNEDRFYNTTDINLIVKLNREFPKIYPVDRGITPKMIIPRSADLCNAIGSKRQATYPDKQIVSFVSLPYWTWKTSEPIQIEPWWEDDGSCVGRCGQGCNGVIPGITSNTDVYSEACFNHDVCADDKGIASQQCNEIFGEAKSDYVNKPDCTSFDIEGPDTVTSNSTTQYITKAHIGSSTYDISTFPGLKYTYSCVGTGCLVASWSSENSLVTKDLQSGTYYATLTTTFSKNGLTRAADKYVTARWESGELILGKWQELVDMGEGEVWEFFEDNTLTVGLKGGGRSASGEWIILRDGRLKISVLTPQGTKTEVAKPRFPDKNTLELYRHDSDKTPAGILTRIIDN